MASIRRYRTQNGSRYEVRWRDGAGAQRSRAFLLRRDAERFSTEIERERQLRGLYLASPERFGEFLQAWLVRHRQRVRPSTYRRDAEALRRAEPLAPLPVSIDTVSHFLAELLGRPAISLKRLVEGMESQVFRFAIDEEAFVLRINISMRGFEKDRWACDAIAGPVPVPRVVQLGWLDADNAYCISEWAPGLSLEESAPSAVQGLAAEVEDVWRRLSAADVSSVSGFGDFDAAGLAPARSWREVLRTTLEDFNEDLPRASRSAGLPDPAHVLETYAQLIDRCPEEHALIHGDFGSNNILAHGTHVTAVLDWENAMVGDALYDVANTYFWATFLPCMQLQADHFDRVLTSLPSYRDRVLCYSLKIGLDEARSNALQGDVRMATWSLGRCIDLVAQRRSIDMPM